MITSASLRGTLRGTLRPALVTRVSAAEGNDDPSLQSVLASTCCDLDATLSLSYSGFGQTWINLVPTPADSAEQTDYDVFLGADNSIPASDDPTFTGTPNSPAAYFALDGADWFTNKLANTTQPRTLRYLHRTDDTNGFWLAWALKTAPSLEAFTGLFASGNISNDTGMTCIFTSTSFAMRAAGGNTTSFDQIFAGDTNYLIIASANAARSSVRLWVNSTTKITQTGNFGANTANPQEASKLFTAFSNGIPISNGSRVYGFAAGNAFINDAEAALIFAHLETRHARDYTP